MDQQQYNYSPDLSRQDATSPDMTRPVATSDDYISIKEAQQILSAKIDQLPSARCKDIAKNNNLMVKR